MVGDGLTGGDKGLGAFPGEVHVEQAIPVQVRELAAIAQEARAAEAMTARSDAGELQGVRFERFHCGQALAMEERGPRQEQRVENLRRERHCRQPAQAVDDEFKDHG